MDAPPDDQPITDRQAILETLERHHVEYVLIGGVAAQTRGWTGQTQDIDVTPAANETNLVRLAGAVREMNGPAAHRRLRAWLRVAPSFCRWASSTA